MKIMFYLGVFGMVLFGCSQSTVEEANSTPVKIIFDSDMGPDYDDVGAMAMLHAFADNGEVEILATMASTQYDNVGPVFSVLNTYFNRPDLPIGVPKGYARDMGDWQGWSDSLVQKYPHALKSNEEAPDAVALYRQILADQPDESVTIVTIGFLSNLAKLLQSPPDEFSTLTGKELVNQKVKLLVSMAGKFPHGMEFNIEEDAGAGKYTFENWEKPIIYSGFEIGEKIKTGLPLIQAGHISDSPVKDVYSISIPMAEEDKDGRMSWDQTALLVAVRGVEPYYQLKSGQIILQEDGYNHWDDKAGNQKHLVENQHPDTIAALINELMMHQPKN